MTHSNLYSRPLLLLYRQHLLTATYITELKRARKRKKKKKKKKLNGKKAKTKQNVSALPNVKPKKKHAESKNC